MDRMKYYIQSIWYSTKIGKNMKHSTSSLDRKHAITIASLTKVVKGLYFKF